MISFHGTCLFKTSHRKYSYANFIGGVLSFRPLDFKQINGYPNNYWGWGLEDDQLGLRMAHHGLRPLRVRLGTFEDLDPVNMKEVLEKGRAQPQQLKQHLPWYNAEMFKHGALELDPDWCTNGLANLKFKQLQEKSDGILHHVKVDLESGFSWNPFGRPKVRLIWPWKVYISSPQWRTRRLQPGSPEESRRSVPRFGEGPISCDTTQMLVTSQRCAGQPEWPWPAIRMWCLEMMEKGWCSRWYLQDLHQFAYRVWDGDQWRPHEAWKRSKDDFCWCFVREDACIQIIRMSQDQVTFKIYQICICPNVLCKRHLFFWTRTHTHTRTTDIQDPVPLEIWWIWILNISWFYQV